MDSLSTDTRAGRIDEIVRHPDDAVTAYTYLDPAEAVLRDLAQDLFGTYWREVVVGPCIEGAVFEISFQQPPEIWSRLHLYYHLRAKVLGESMPADFEGAAMAPHHG